MEGRKRRTSCTWLCQILRNFLSECTFSHIISLFLSSSHLLSLSLSCPLALCHGLSPSFSFLSADEVPRNGYLFAQNEVRLLKAELKFGFWSVLESLATLSHEMRVPVLKTFQTCRKLAILALPLQRFRTKWSSGVEKCGKNVILKLLLPPCRTKSGLGVWYFSWTSLFGLAATLAHETRFKSQKPTVFGEFGWSCYRVWVYKGLCAKAPVQQLLCKSFRV